MTLPVSFTTNTWERILRFLQESNAIESIREFDYADTSLQDPQAGHFGALVQALHLAESRTPLSHRHVCAWQALMTREQLKGGHGIEENEIGRTRGPALQKNVRIGKHIPPDFSEVPTLLSALIEDINDKLRNQDQLTDDVEYCRFLGKSFHKFESIHPFADGNGRTGRLLVAYIATYCQRPLIVFNGELCEKNRYYEAHVTSQKMIQHLTKKLREVIFSSDRTLLIEEGQQEWISTYSQGFTYDWSKLSCFWEE